MKKNVSIIIPTKDRLESLKKVIHSYLSQEAVLEVIVVNDGSTDGTTNYVKGLQKDYKNLRLIVNELNQGLPYTRNIGIKKSLGEYIFMGEDDAEISRGHIKKLIRHLKANRAHIAAGRMIYLSLDETTEEGIIKANKINEELIHKKTININFSKKIAKDVSVPISHSLMLINKNVFNSCLYDEGYKINFWREETDFQLSAVSNGFKIIYCPHTNIYHHTTIQRGGCRSVNKLTYEYWVFKNNYYFVKKNSKILKRKFNIDNIFSYFIRFTASRLKVHFNGLLGKIRILFSKPGITFTKISYKFR